MTTDADAQGPKLTSAIWAPLQMVQHRTCVCVEARELLGRLQRIAAIGAGLIIRQHRPGSFKLVINLGDRNDVSMPRNHCCRPANRPGHLENLGKENDSGILTRRCWPGNVRPHRPVSCR